jgi:hypothetical protein
MYFGSERPSRKAAPAPRPPIAVNETWISASEEIQSKFQTRIAWWGSLADRFPGLLTAVLCALYSCAAAIAAAQKALWYDELFTFHVSRLSGFGAIWNALARGVDNHAPLDYWLRHVFMRVFGTSELAFRLPSIIAFGIALFCLIRLVAKRSSMSCGLLAGLILLSTQAHQYAYEGRAYASLIAWAVISLLCWQLAAEGKRGALIGLSAALAAGLYSHYYGVLLFVPLVAGEIWRSVERRRIDWGVWLAFGLAIIPLVTMMPLIKAAKPYASGFWTPVDVHTLIDIYMNIVGASALVLLVLLCWRLLMSRAPAYRGDNHGDMPSYEIAAAAGYLLLPLFCYVMAKSITGALFYRYVVSAVTGVAILASLAVYRIAKNAGVAIAVAIICLSLIAGDAWVEGYRGVAKKAGTANLLNELNRWLPDSGEPLVVANGVRFAQWAHYAAPRIQQRLTYVASLEDSLNLKGTNTQDRALLGLRSLLPSPVMKYQDFKEQNPHFRMIMPDGSWQLNKLLQDGASINAVGIFRGEPVYDVSFSKTAVPNSAAPTTSR